MDSPIYLRSHIAILKEKYDYCEVPDLETKIRRPDNPTKGLLQIKQFQYKLVQKITLNQDTVPQIKVFSHFLLKFFRFNYQLWKRQNQNASFEFPQVSTRK